jgi:putative Holliday junction resolvase
VGRILAIDYGQKRVGVAVTDELQIIAGPLATVHSKDILEFLSGYLKMEHVDCIVVGQPVQMDGSPSESAQIITVFINRFMKLFPAIPVIRMDERFTSKMASWTIREAGARKKDRQDKGLVDKVSAVIILQSYLEMRGNRV